MKFLFRRFAPLAFFASVSPLIAHGQSHWLPYGPDGGDARSFASDPHDHNHIYLGTTSGTIYDTHDGGQSWKRIARVGKRDDLVLDNIVVDPADPNHVLVGGWVLDRADGGLYVTTDGGKTWQPNGQMNGHSIRALTVAPSDPKTMILGALDGVFRSTDAGATWTLISPQGSTELHEIESIAIDPKNAQTIYAGTWHLPWKTTDGGKTWTNMKQGIIDDSDVFSIIVDPSNAQNVFLSACSGIYRSTNEGANFTKVQGIPSTARRTRVLMEDIQHTGTVFAGTTEGLWRTTDSGHTFLRNGDPGWIINDVNIDAQNSNRVLLATDRTGVLVSNDGGTTFAPANKGFSARQISAVAQDKSNPSKLYVGVINDKTAGGVFASEDGGLTWTQKSNGLGGADIFSLAEAPDGTMLAGTRHGIYRLKGDNWQSSGLVLALPPEVDPNAAKPVAKGRRGKQAARAKASSNPAPKGNTGKSASTVETAKVAPKRAASVTTGPQRSTPAQQSNTGVFAMTTSEGTVFAATEEGVLYSTDNGMSWNRLRSAKDRPYRQVDALGSKVVAADLQAIAVSTDKGMTFKTVTGPSGLTYVSSIAVDETGRIWLGGREGVFFSEDDGATWKTNPHLFVPDVSALFYDATGKRVLVTSNKPNTIVFAVHTPDMKVTFQEAGWALRGVRPVGDHLVGITPYDGVVLQPKMVDSQPAGQKS